MKKLLCMMVTIGVVISLSSMIALWMMFDYRAAGLAFSAMLGIIGIYEAFRSIDAIDDVENEGDDE